MREIDGGPPKGCRGLSASTALAHGVTLGPGGETLGWDRGHLRSSRTEVRRGLDNVERDPRIRLLIVDPENPYRCLEIRGEGDPGRDCFIDAMARNDGGRDVYSGHGPGEERVGVHVAPRHETRMGG